MQLTEEQNTDMTVQEFYSGFNLDFLNEQERQTIYTATEMFALGKVRQEREKVKPLLESAKELDEYLSETLFEKGKPVHLNYVGAFSILHKKIKEALSQYSI